MLNKGGRSVCRAATGVTALQDLGCLDAPKYVYRFHVPIQEKLRETFYGCDIKVFRFSEYTPNAKDLLKVRKVDEFQAHFIVGGFTATVYFSGAVLEPSKWLLDAFDNHIYDAGYGTVKHLPAQPPQCDLCPVRQLKKCS